MTTPGTRLAWDTAADWLRCLEELGRRRISAAVHRARRTHLEALGALPWQWFQEQPLEDLEALRAVLRKLAPPTGQRAGTPYAAAIGQTNNAISNYLTAPARFAATLTRTKGKG